MYTQVGIIPKEKITELEELLKNAKWKIVRGPGIDFKTWFVDIEIEGYDIEQSFFLCIPPGGRVHRHIDTPRPQKTYHIPVETNLKAKNYMYTPERTGYHLEVGKIYWVDRSISHDSVNEGETDRIHLLIECNKWPT